MSCFFLKSISAFDIDIDTFIWRSKAIATQVQGPPQSQAGYGEPDKLSYKKANFKN